MTTLNNNPTPNTPTPTPIIIQYKGEDQEHCTTTIDDLTNIAMDAVRRFLGYQDEELDEDNDAAIDPITKTIGAISIGDLDDALYTEVHNAFRAEIELINDEEESPTSATLTEINNPEPLSCPSCRSEHVHPISEVFVEQGEYDGQRYEAEGETMLYKCSACGYAFIPWN
ncbi:hypothetical protein [Pantanalinema sp. GBBB05]|uniref:hypothetical protein n=1 Tax=Pantanalinema sp. GBBB05 TaxID=2604139 RepID=UPI001DF3DD7C|nr:hypothetical protein [Pantanalinema sp. GBBB05]